MSIRLLPFFISILLIASCNKDDASLSEEDQVILNYLTENSIDANRDVNGIYYYAEHFSGTGISITSDSILSIYYTLTDLDDNVIDSHLESDGEPLKFKHNVSAVYPIGIDIAVSYMQVGDIYSFILPARQAYANLNSGLIDSDIIPKITIEVVSMELETTIFNNELEKIETYILEQNLNDTIANPKDSVIYFPTSNLYYKRKFEGTGNLPLNGDTIGFDYSASFLVSGNEFANGINFEYVFGSSKPRPIVEGLDLGISLMQVDERALLILPSNIAYRESALVIPDFITSNLADDGIVPRYVERVPPYVTLIFDITRNN